MWFLEVKTISTYPDDVTVTTPITTKSNENKCRLNIRPPTEGYNARRVLKTTCKN